MNDDDLRSLLRTSEDQTYWFTFVDGTAMKACVVSVTHVDLDDTVVVLGAYRSPDELGWNLAIADIRSVTTPAGVCLFDRS